MGAHRCAMGAGLAELNMSVPKIGDTPEGSPRCRLRTSRISESWHGALASRQVWVRLDRVDHLHRARMRGRCSSVSGPISVRSDRGSLGPQAVIHSPQQRHIWRSQRYCSFRPLQEPKHHSCVFCRADHRCRPTPVRRSSRGARRGAHRRSRRLPCAVSQMRLRPLSELRPSIEHHVRSLRLNEW